MEHRSIHYPCRRTLRLSMHENRKLEEQARLLGLSVSAYMRHLCCGGTLVLPKTDAATIRELRRLGGLLKHHFSMVDKFRRPVDMEAANALMHTLRNAIEALSKPS